MLFLVIMLIIVFLFLLIMSIKFKIKIENLEYNSHKHMEKDINKKKIETHYNTNYKIKIIIYTLNILPIFKITLNRNKIEKINNKTHIEEKLKEKINEQELINLQLKYNLKKYIPILLKTIKIDINSLNLKIELGTKSPILTSFIIPTISTVITILLVKTQKNIDNKIFRISPVYINDNIIKIKLYSELEVKFINILSATSVYYKEFILPKSKDNIKIHKNALNRI